MRSRVILFLFAFIAGTASGQWTQQVSNTGKNLFDIVFINDSVGFAVGDSGTFLKTENRGEEWLSSVIASSSRLYNISPLNADTLFVSSKNGVYKSENGGEEWTLIFDDLPVFEVVFFDPLLGFAKTSWYEECTAGWGGCYGTRYKYFRTEDGGLNWSVYYPLDIYIAAGSIEKVNENVAYMFGTHYDCQGGSYPCQFDYYCIHNKTINGGLDWTSDGCGPGREYFASSFINDSIGFIVDHYGVTRLWKTTGGSSSLNMVAQLTEKPAKIAFANESEGFYIRRNKICTTTSGGQDWSFSYATVDLLSDIYITANSHVYIVGNNGLILTNTVDSGLIITPVYLIQLNKPQIDFPITAVNGEHIETLKISSPGNMDIWVNITAPPDFFIKTEDDTIFSTHIDSLRIKAEHDTLINIAFRPLEAREYNENLEIHSNAFNDTTILVPLAGKAIVAISGIITRDTLICHDTVMVIGNTTISPGARMTICPGTIMLFTGRYYLQVEGSLLARGLPGDSIKFSSVNKTEGWDGIHISSGDPDSVILEYCHIEYGNANYVPFNARGSGIGVINKNEVRVSHCVISDCYAQGDGAGIYLYNSSPIIEYCEIKNNHSRMQGAGIHCYNGNPFIKSNSIHHNYAEGSGGGLSFDDSSPLIINNTIYSNIADSRGGGISIIGDNNGNPASIIQNLIFNNKANVGGGIFYSLTQPNNLVNTICNNQADEGGGMKGLNCDENAAKGCIFYGNSGGQISAEQNPLSFYWCNIQGGWTGSGQGNIDANPEFMSPSPDSALLVDDIGIDWSFLSSSPCYNAGIPDTALPDIPLLDFAGYPRIYDGRMDIGAYEAHFNKALPDTVICTGDSIRFTANPSGTGPFTFQWMHNDIDIPGEVGVHYFKESANHDDAGIYQYKVISQAGSFASNKGLLTLTDSLPRFTVQPQGSLVKQDSSVILRAYARFSMYYQWFHNETLLAGETDTNLVITGFSAEQQGNYRCYSENVCGGIFSEPALLLIDPSLIDEHDGSVFRIYPNPAGSQLIVDTRQSIASMEILDRLGRKLRSFKNISSFPFTINISDFSDGMYVVRIYSEEGFSGTSKFIKVTR